MNEDLGNVQVVTVANKINWKLQAISHWLSINVKNKLIRLMGGVPADRSGNYLNHFNREANHAWGSEPEINEMQQMICDDIRDLLAVLGAQGHSGGSIGYALDLFRRAAMFEPIGPLTGEDDEWCDIDPNMGGDVQQNKRMSSVFRRADGVAYWIDGYAFQGPEQYDTFTSGMSRKRIEFPWNLEKTEYVDITYDEDSETIYPDWIIEKSKELNEAEISNENN